MIKRRCKQCGKDFTLTDSEIKFYNDKNLELPKRCCECRRKNKKSNDTMNNLILNKEKEKNSYIKTTTNINKSKNILKSIIAVILVFILLLIGKIFNIIPNFGDGNLGLQSGQSTTYLEFRNNNLLEDHFEKHKDEFGYTSIDQYLNGANAVINSPESKHKLEGEDGDEIYYNENKNEIVFVSKDGYIRTYFKPKNGIEYYNRQ